jgi:hypothetical protein
MSGEPKILLTTLWQRTSERGNEYLSGCLGKARIVGFGWVSIPSDGLSTILRHGNSPAAARRGGAR